MFKKTIKKIQAREILDSRGLPAVETTVVLSDGSLGRVGVPGGTSTGEAEARELRDGDYKRFRGQGVLKAVGNVNGEIAGRLRGEEAGELSAIDLKLKELDGTKNKSRLGANAILSVSVAVALASAKSYHQSLYKYLSVVYGIKASQRLPVPMFNIFNGGKHGDTKLDFQ